MSLKESLIRLSPYLVQNTAVTLFNVYQYKIRHGGHYTYFREFYRKVDYLNEQDLNNEILKKKEDFFTYVLSKSEWYKCQNSEGFEQVHPLEKIDIINNLDKIKTISESEGIVSLTGGTTGASMKVIYTKKDMQERFAILDHFRAQHG